MMDKHTQIIPIGHTTEDVDEAAEFRALSDRIDARRRSEIAAREIEYYSARQKRKNAVRSNRKIARNIALMLLGASAVCCGLSAALAWQSPQPALAFYPAVLGLISAAVGARLRW